MVDDIPGDIAEGPAGDKPDLAAEFVGLGLRPLGLDPVLPPAAPGT